MKNVCPNCRGRGFIASGEYPSEDRRRCSGCSGHGVRCIMTVDESNARLAGTGVNIFRRVRPADARRTP